LFVVGGVHGGVEESQGAAGGVCDRVCGSAVLVYDGVGERAMGDFHALFLVFVLLRAGNLEFKEGLWLMAWLSLRIWGALAMPGF
jgi:hypothetical protein